MGVALAELHEATGKSYRHNHYCSYLANLVWEQLKITVELDYQLMKELSTHIMCQRGIKSWS